MNRSSYGKFQAVALVAALLAPLPAAAQFSALVSEFSPRTHVGTALTLQTCLGFLLTMVSLRLLPLVAASVGWRWSFLLLVPGPVLGALAMKRLARS